MKKILITGANSYIGVSFENFMKGYADYQVETVDMLDGCWREKDFSLYDVVFHVAGIAHQKETKENASLYYKVNRDLAVEVAKKAKEQGVKQFVFLSTMSVYGKNTGVITKETQPAPTSNYGKSKVQAEKEITSLSAENFIVTILRPPMVYGKDCKGNFQSVVKLVKKTFIFPNVKNQRSLIFIDNLSKQVKWVVDKEYSGLFFPQNEELIQTSKMAKLIANKLGKKLYMSLLLGLAVKVLTLFFKPAKKAFGSLVYDIEKEYDLGDLVKFEQSIEQSV